MNSETGPSTTSAAAPSTITAKNPAAIDTTLRTTGTSFDIDALTRRLHSLDQFRSGLLRIPIQHARVVEIEQPVLDAREPRALAALDDDDVLRLVRVQDRHAVDRAGLVGPRHRIHHVVRPDDQ